MFDTQRWRCIWLRPADAETWIHGFLLLEPPRRTCWLMTAQQLPSPAQVVICVAPGQPLAGARFGARVHASAQSGHWSRAWAELRAHPVDPDSRPPSGVHIAATPRLTRVPHVPPAAPS